MHMHRVARRLTFTKRTQVNLSTVIEVTETFRRVCPDDPVKYDFALTRPGIRGDSSRDPSVRGMRARSASPGKTSCRNMWLRRFVPCRRRNARGRARRSTPHRPSPPARVHGGDLRVPSETQKGSTFEVVLPSREAA
ncbi:MAG: DUF2400 family protein [bacterium]